MWCLTTNKPKCEALPQTSLYGDIPMGVLKVVLYAQSASSNFKD